MVERTCQHCGQPFKAWPRDVRKGWGKYCSRQCRGAAKRGPQGLNWRGGQVACKCLNCGKTFYEDPSRVKAGRGKHCSQACYWARVRGEEHWKYRHGRGRFPYAGGFTKAIREQVIARDRVCVDCGGWDDRPRGMQVHHLDFGHDNHALENLVLLCLECHVRRHQSNSCGNSASRVDSRAAASAR